MNGVISHFLRRLLNQLTNRGIDHMAKRGNGDKATPQSRKQAKMARDAVKRARQAARITRRMGR